MNKVLWIITYRHSYSTRTTIGKMFFEYYKDFVSFPNVPVKEYFGYTLEDTARPGNVKVYEETCLPGNLICDVSLFENNHYGKTIIFHTELDKITIKYGELKWVGCLAHGGNTIADTSGCILVARNYINKDRIQGSLKAELRTFIEQKIKEGYTIKAKFINLTQTDISLSINFKNVIMNTSWKTMVVGAALAILIAIQPLIETGEVKLKSILLAALVALFSYLVKDKDVTGGTRSNKMLLKK